MQNLSKEHGKLKGLLPILKYFCILACRVLNFASGLHDGIKPPWRINSSFSVQKLFVNMTIEGVGLKNCSPDLYFPPASLVCWRVKSGRYGV